jgi:purine nucleosidase
VVTGIHAGCSWAGWEGDILAGAMSSDARRLRVVVDTDAGLDDAHALMYLLAQPDIDLVGITTCFGNTLVRNVARNVAAVLAVAERSDIPVYVGAAHPLRHDVAIDTAWHGADGLGDRGLAGADPPAQSMTAAEFLVHVVNQQPGTIDLLLLGPLTNAALALDADRDLLCKCRSVVVMGGGGPYPKPGDMTVPDANSAHDRAAAERFYAAPNVENVEMVGMNATMQALLDEAAFATLSSGSTPWARFATEILDASNDTYQHLWGRRVSVAHDGLASVLMHRPDLVKRSVTGPATFTEASGSLAVHVARTYTGGPLSFPTPPGPAIRAVAEFDEPEFSRLFMSALLTREPSPE